MQKLIIILLLLMSGLLFGQSVPQAFNYQGIAVDANGDAIANGVVGLRFSIIEGSASGTPLYVENQQVNTTGIGHFAADVGEGTLESGNFNNINWSSGRYFLKTELDGSGGSNYTFTYVGELLSVPYALVAQTSENSPQGLVGLRGERGTKGEQGRQGQDGDPGFSTTTGVNCWDLNGNGVQDTSEDTNGDGEYNIFDCQGSVGRQGNQGVMGIKGEKGLTGVGGGEKGDEGPKGDTGPKGTTEGPQGLQGEQGEMGLRGEQGPRGEKGLQGNPGNPSNVQGPKGETGPQGFGGGQQGIRGDTGPPGLKGLQGAPGAPGPSGQSFQEYLQIQSSPPNAPEVNRIYLDNGNNRNDGKQGFRVWNGTEWKDI